MRRTHTVQNLLRLVQRSYARGWEDSVRQYEELHPKSKSTNRRKSRIQKTVLTLSLLLAANLLVAQELTQTIRGKVIDQQSQAGVVGANIIVQNSNPLLGSSTDADGNFRIADVPIGRHTLLVTSIGYENAVIPELVVGSGKEVVLTIRLTESLVQMEEIVISAADQEKGKPSNDLAYISARSFTVEETKRYAASVNDPARMALSFAGVASNDDQSNNIVIRGNSPRGLLWRVEGVEVPNPNHFGEEGASGGGISMLSVNMLDNSDFYTGAFPAEYGNASSGVFDIKLRKGNNEKREYAFQAGVLGVDFAAEGPFSKNSRASYLINYRYSTLAVLSQLGIEVSGDAVPNFQDAALKIHVPTRKAGSFSLWGVGGLSRQDIDDPEEKESFRYNMGTAGLSHVYFFGQRTYLESIVSYSQTLNAFSDDEPPFNYNFEERFRKSSLRGSFLLNHKFSARHTLRTGVIASHLNFDLLAEGVADTLSFTEVDSDGSTQLWQGYAQWQFRATEALTFNAGLHHMYFRLNDSQSLEPRVGLRWAFAPGQTLSAGFGVHSRVDPLVNYFATFRLNPDAPYTQPNRNLDLTKSRHYVVGYERTLRDDLRLKVEAYYQQLYDVPIGLPAGSDIPWYRAYSLINYQEGIVDFPLGNNGTGRNYGVEFTLEKFFTQNYYFMLTTSLFESKYTPLSGEEYDTRFNGNHVINFLGGKEFKVGRNKNNVLGLNFRISWVGGNRYTPVDIAASREAGRAVVQWDRPYAAQVPDYFRPDVRVSYRWNRAKYSSILSLDVQNVINRSNIFTRFYSASEGDMVDSFQLGLIPVLNYRIEF
ncbi:MAG: carboxypeptidase regulatory-like domain-containing protein [Cyclobacteriaceae bacterium]